MSRVSEENRLEEQLMSSIKSLPGDCFDIPRKHPHMIGKFHVIYVQNLEHFLHPEKHQDFLTLNTELLAPGDIIILCANTPYFHVKQDNDKKIKEYNKIILDAETKENLYYGWFLQREVEYEQDNNKFSPVRTWAGELEFLEDHSIECDTETISIKNFHDYKTIKQRIVRNHFTPKIYKDAVAQHPKLKVIDSFFMRSDGLRFKETKEPSWFNKFCGLLFSQSNTKEDIWPTTYAVAIVRKKEESHDKILKPEFF